MKLVFNTFTNKNNLIMVFIDELPISFIWYFALFLPPISKVYLLSTIKSPFFVRLYYKDQVWLTKKTFYN